MQTHLDTLIALIRESIDEEWIDDFEIGTDTSFNDDLELESIELVAIADRIQAHYGTRIDFIGWLSSLELDEVINLTVGDLAGFVERNVGSG